MAASAILISTAGRADAHNAPTLGYTRITAEGDTVVWTLYFDPDELDPFLHLDTDGDGTVGAAEVEAARGVLAGLAQPNVQASDPASGEQPDGEVGTIALVGFRSTGLHSEGFADLPDFPLVAVPVRFTFAHLDLEAVQLRYDLFVLPDFGEHINIAEVDLDGYPSSVFQFDPGIQMVTIGDAVHGTAPRDPATTTAPTGASTTDAGSRSGAPAASSGGSSASSGSTTVPVLAGVGIVAGLAVAAAVARRRAADRRPVPELGRSVPGEGRRAAGSTDRRRPPVSAGGPGTAARGGSARRT